MEVATHKCKNHPEADGIHVNRATNDLLCVGCTLRIRRSEIAGHKSVISKQWDLDRIRALGEGRHSLRLYFQVTAGVVPTHPAHEFTEQWWIDSDSWDRMLKTEGMSPDHPDNIFMRAQAEAYWYAQAITQPSVINWVRTDFFYV